MRRQLVPWMLEVFLVFLVIVERVKNSVGTFT